MRSGHGIVVIGTLTRKRIRRLVADVKSSLN